MDDTEITTQLRKAVHYYERLFRVRCTLSEILYLRDCVTRSTLANRGIEGLFQASEPFYDAFALLLREYYGIEWTDLWYRVPSGERQEGKIIIGRLSPLVSEDPDGLVYDPKFIEVFKRIREESYVP